MLLLPDNTYPDKRSRDAAALLGFPLGKTPGVPAGDNKAEGKLSVGMAGTFLSGHSVGLTRVAVSDLVRPLIQQQEAANCALHSGHGSSNSSEVCAFQARTHAGDSRLTRTLGLESGAAPSSPGAVKARPWPQGSRPRVSGVGGPAS